MQVALLLRRLGSHLLPLHLESIRWLRTKTTGCCPKKKDRKISENGTWSEVEPTNQEKMGLEVKLKLGVKQVDSRKQNLYSKTELGRHGGVKCCKKKWGVPDFSWIRRPAGVSCGSCLFVVVLSVLSLSRLPPLARIFASSDLNPPPPPPRLALLRFVFIFPYVVVGSTLPTPRSTPAWFCTSCGHFDGCSRFFVVLPSVCSIASYIQYLIHWFLCWTPFTRMIFLNMAFSKAFLNMAFSKTLVYTHALV